MKNTMTVLATLASLVIALPGSHEVKRSSELSTDTTIGTLTWTGLLHPGAPRNTTLSGIAKDIYEQILNLNPNYNLWDFDDFRANMKAKDITQDIYESDFKTLTITPTTPNPAAAAAWRLKKREEPSFDCNAGADYAWWQNCNEGRAYMRALGRGHAQCAVNGGSARASAAPGTVGFGCVVG